MLDPKVLIVDIIGIKPSGSADPDASGSVATGSGFPSGSYEKLETYITTLGADKFEPPLSLKQKSPSQEFYVHPIPNNLKEDPRRTGRLFVVDAETVKNKDLLSWIYNNSLLYGFLPYGSPEPNAFYFVGKEKVKDLVRTAGDVAKVVSTFLGSILPKDIITISTDKVLTHSLTPGTEFADPGNAEEVVAVIVAGVTTPAAGLIVTNNKIDLLLYKPAGEMLALRADAAFAYAAMKAAAANESPKIGLRLTSAYRPPLGSYTKMVTSKGTELSVTTQYSLRVSNLKEGIVDKSDNQYMRGPMENFHPATAPPGSSFHGDGLALDLNTGGFPELSAKTPFSQGGRIMEWLTRNAHRYGFIRSVPSEAWHFEYLPPGKPNKYNQSSATGPYTIIKSNNSQWGPYGNQDWNSRGGFLGSGAP